MKTEKDYIKELAHIRSMMERSTKFLSLTGLSGICAGIYALVGAFIADRWLQTPEEVGVFYWLLLAVGVLIFALSTAVFLSRKRAKRTGERLWNPVSKRLLINLAIPLCTGGVFVAILVLKDMPDMIAPAILIFYGLALVNASKFTFEELQLFGSIEVLLGLVAAYFASYSLLFWAIGFGVMHILYGIYMHLKYER